MPIEYSHEVFPVQTLPTGDHFSIHAYNFKGSKPGPHIYIQANQHGPEILGVPLVGKAIEYLQTLEDINGSITLVPCSNPMGVNDATLALDGRWNKKSGLNWNRIHDVNEQWLSLEQKNEFYTEQFHKTGATIEEKLAAALQLIAGIPEYMIDIHAAGLYSCNYMFQASGTKDDFRALETELSIWNAESNNPPGSFKSAFVKPFEHYPGPKPKSITWEVCGDQHIDRKTLDARWYALKSWLNEKLLGIEPNLQQAGPLWGQMSDFKTIHSHEHGYCIWEKKVGDIVKPGEKYITYYDPSNNTFFPVSEKKKFLLVSQYTIGAVGEGEEIGELLWLE